MGGKSEKGSVGHGVGEVSSNGLHVSGESTITAEDLNQIFGIDCRLATQEALVEMGVFREGQRLEFFSRPKPHIYLRDEKEIVSSALYFVDMVVGDDAVMASYVPQHRESTRHLHRFGITEYYRSIAGRAKLRLRNQTVELGEHNRDFTVEEHSIHQFSTNSSPAFTLLIMRNAGLVHRDLWHEMSDEEVVID